MYYFSETSKRKLSECDEQLQRIAYVAIKGYGFTVVCGHRNKTDQNAAYTGGFSTKKFPNSKHNSKPSKAMDIIPDAGGWNAGRKQFILMIGMIKGIALNLGIKIRVGIDFNSDNDLQNDNFIDSAHVELCSTEESK